MNQIEFTATMTKVEKRNKWWNPEVEALADDIRKTFKDKFPRSHITIRPVGLGYGVEVQFTLGENADEYHYRIHNNDPMHMIFHVYGFDCATGIMQEAMEFIGTRAYLTLPPKDKYLYCSHQNTFRKISGNNAKLLAGWKKYIDKLHGLVLENADGMQQYTPVNVLEKLAK